MAKVLAGSLLATLSERLYAGLSVLVLRAA